MVEAMVFWERNNSRSGASGGKGIPWTEDLDTEIWWN